MSDKDKLTGSVYIGVVGPETDFGLCRDSIHAMVRRPGDAAPLWVRATKGFEARQMHLNNWIDNTHHEFMLLLDHDQVFPPDTLERLRNHGLPYVSGFYMRRQFNPIAPVWFKPFSGVWPFEPWTTRPEKGQLHAIGASGWGCILMHRSVIEGVREVLKGEREILEDDMDIWPYDLARLMTARNGIIELVEEQPPAKMLRAALSEYARMLDEELRVLRGLKTNIGSDIRFPFYALQAGFQLYGDPDVECAHMVNYPLSGNDFALVPDDNIEMMTEQSQKEVQGERERIVNALRGLLS